MRGVLKSLLAMVVLALVPLVALELVAGEAVAAVVFAFVGLLMSTLVVALIRETLHNVRNERAAGTDP